MYPKSLSRCRCRSGNFLKVGVGAGAETNSFGSATLYVRIYITLYIYHIDSTSMYIQKTELTENDNFRLCAANEKRRR